MIDNYLYYVYDKYGKGKHLFCDRQEAYKYYDNYGGYRIEAMTKDLYPTYITIVDRPHFDITRIKEDFSILKTTLSKRNATKKYDQKNTVQIKLKLNKKTDKELIELLSSVDNKQGLIKDLLKKYIESC